MKNYAYIHAEKLKEWGRGKQATRSYRQNQYRRNWGVQGCWEHDLRLIETANADSKKFKENSIACAESDWKASRLEPEIISKIACDQPDFIVKKAKKRLADLSVSYRDDQVKVMMLLSAASPQFLRDGDEHGPLNETKVKKWADATAKFLRKKYGDNLLAIVVHRDEQNPHLTAYMLPAVQKLVRNRGPKKKKPDPSGDAKTNRIAWVLSASDLFTPDPYEIRKSADGKSKKVHTDKGTCSLLQDEYADALKQAGLDLRRGVRRAPAQTALEHETTKTRYERLTTSVKEIEFITDPAELRETATTLAVQAAEARRAMEERNHYQIAAGKAQESLASLQRKIEADSRVIPVAEALEALTGLPAQPSETNAKLFVFPNGQKLEIDESTNKFCNLTPDIPGLGNMQTKKGGSGAIDAVIYVTGWSFLETVEWLNDRFSPTVATAAVAAHLNEEPKTDERIERVNHDDSVQKSLVTADPAQWLLLSEHLVSECGISSEVLKTFSEIDLISANQFGHLVFNKMKSASEDGGKIICDPRSTDGFRAETGQDDILLLASDCTTQAIIVADPLHALALKSQRDFEKSAVIVVGKNPGNKAERTLTDLFKAWEAFFAETLFPTASKIAGWLKKTIPTLKPWTPPPDGGSFFEFVGRFQKSRAKVKQGKTDIDEKIR